MPTDFTKKTDTRSKAFVAKHGDVSVELDALPAHVLRSRLIEEVEKRNLDALALVRTQEATERAQLVKVLQTIS